MSEDYTDKWIREMRTEGDSEIAARLRTNPVESAYAVALHNEALARIVERLPSRITRAETPAEAFRRLTKTGRKL